MKSTFKSLIIVIVSISVHTSLSYSQGMKTIESIRKELDTPLHDTTRVNRLSYIGYQYRVIQLDSAKLYCLKALSLARSIGYKSGEAMALSNLAWTYRFLSDYNNAQKYLTEAEKMATTFGFQSVLANIYQIKSFIYYDLNDFKISVEYALKSKEIYHQLGDVSREITTLIPVIDVLDIQGHYDSAFIEAKNLYNFAYSKNTFGTYGILSSKLARAYLRLNQLDSASNIIEKTLLFGNDERNTRVIMFGNQMKGELFERRNQLDSAIYYLNEAYQLGVKYKFYANALSFSSQLTSLYNKKNDSQNAYKFLNISTALKDSVHGVEKMIELQKLLIGQQNEAFVLKEESLINATKRKQNIFLGLAALFIGFTLIQMWNNNKIKKLHEREKEQKQTIEKAFIELRNTQNQLIQKEKLASLGELTAGIAHEIQNPLNFVNNFSELSVDLVKDLKDELNKTDKDQAYIDELFDDLSQNQEKINHHGKRASNIVKGMLEHSRASTGERVLTDINALCDEYLRLSYHGMRAKDKSFNADFKTEFDPNLPHISIVSQDIGRVLLNLFNNAFYAVNEKRKQNTEGGYQPTVSISTMHKNDFIEIKVTDNGNGIPDAIKEKIFQPFFTTKPTGEGTGLGLSLSYDIVTNGHGGTLDIETKQGEFTTFIIKLF